jgi:hypothetical protein
MLSFQGLHDIFSRDLWFRPCNCNKRHPNTLTRPWLDFRRASEIGDAAGSEGDIGFGINK